MKTIKASVGRSGQNIPVDVKTVQALLNEVLPPHKALKVDGRVGARTIGAIETVQKQFRLRRVDGRVDPGGFTITVLAGEAKNLGRELPRNVGIRGISDRDFKYAATTLDCDISALKAVAKVEAAGNGYFMSGRPKMLFEAHIFSRRTAHRFDQSHPNISSHSWNRALYTLGENEYRRLELAMLLDSTAALESASWGRFQIMGFNYREAGYATVTSFVQAMFQSEANHLKAFVNFIRAKGLASTLKNRDWKAFAARYNGPAYARHGYDAKIRAAFEEYSAAKP